MRMADRVAGELTRLAGVDPEGVWQGPGRVNLIGEHTDYNAGLALPFALDRRTTVALRRRTDRTWRCWSLGEDTGGQDTGGLDTGGQDTGGPETGGPGHRAEPEATTAELDDLGADRPSGWARYVLGVAWAFQELGAPVPGADLVVGSTVPIGSGLSSSAALTAAVAVAIDELTGSGLGPSGLVEVCHRAESGFVGAPTGTLDQRAVLLAEAGHALLLDFAAGSSEAVSLAGVGPLVVVDTGVRHDHATGEYGARRRDCEQAAARLGLASLREATLEQVEARLSGRLLARARHVVTEDDRVVTTVARLRAGLGIGDLLTDSHRSLRDDFEVSCPELDAVVDAALRAGADGARMTGGGFGGSAIVAGLAVEDAKAAATAALAPLGQAPAAVFEAVPSGPAGRVPGGWTAER